MGVRLTDDEYVRFLGWHDELRALKALLTNDSEGVVFIPFPIEVGKELDVTFRKSAGEVEHLGKAIVLSAWQRRPGEWAITFVVRKVE